MNKVHPASFRDPNGFVFRSEDALYRQVQQSYKDHYDHLIESGLYSELLQLELLIAHEEASLSLAIDEHAYKILKPECIPFLSYPYEWSFSELKDAALATLRIQQLALEKGMVLKDASAFNIQFRNGKPVLMDTLSFERYQDGSPWVAYRQFCQHFLAPLGLMAYRDVRMNQLLRIHIDGIPLDLASTLLPYKTRWKVAFLSHIHMHAKSQKKYASKAVDKKHYKITLFQLKALIDSLQSAVNGLHWNAEGTEWGSYYDSTNYAEESMNQKARIVESWLKQKKPQLVWDLGANTGRFSRIASEGGALTISFDLDPAAVEKNYLQLKEKKEKNLLPLILDLTNPSPAIGFENRERMSLEERGPADVILALALIHHLAISNNVPLARIAEYFSRLCSSLIIEFVPKNDSQVQRLLTTREDIFPEYNEGSFERDFKEFFTILDSVKLSGSERTLYLMQAGNKERGH